MSELRAPIEEVIEVLGGLTKTADALGIDNPSVVSNWRRRRQVPVDWVEEVERVSGISRHRLRPDLSRIFSTPNPEAQARLASEVQS